MWFRGLITTYHTQCHLWLILSPFLACFIVFRCIYTPSMLAFKIGRLFRVVACGVFLCPSRPVLLSLAPWLPGFLALFPWFALPFLFLALCFLCCRPAVWRCSSSLFTRVLYYNNVYKYLHFAPCCVVLMSCRVCFPLLFVWFSPCCVAFRCFRAVAPVPSPCVRPCVRPFSRGFFVM